MSGITEATADSGSNFNSGCFIVHEGKENKPLDPSKIFTAFEEVVFDEKVRKRPARIPSGFGQNVYSGPEDKQDHTNSGKGHVWIRATLMQLPQGRSVAVPIGKPKPVVTQDIPATAVEDEEPWEETPVGSIVHRRKSVRFDNPNLAAEESSSDAQAATVATAEDSSEVDSLRNLVQEGGSKISRNLKILEPQAQTPEAKDEDSRLKKLFWAIVQAIYQFVMAIFERMKLVICWTPTQNAIKA